MRGAIHQTVERARLLLLAVALWLCAVPMAQAIRCPTPGPALDSQPSQLNEEMPSQPPDACYVFWAMDREGRIGLFVRNNPGNGIDPFGLAYGDLLDPRTYFGNPPGVTVLPNSDLYMPPPVNPANSITYGGLHGIDLSITGGQLPGDFIGDQALQAGKNSVLVAAMLTPVGEEEEAAAKGGGGLLKWLKNLWSRCKSKRAGADALSAAEKAALASGRIADLESELAALQKVETEVRAQYQNGKDLFAREVASGRNPEEFGGLRQEVLEELPQQIEYIQKELTRISGELDKLRSAR